MERFLTVLKSYKRMPLELEQTLRENVCQIEVRKREIIQKVGIFTDNLYFVEKGLFRFYGIRWDGEEVTFGFKREDQFIICLKEIFEKKIDVGDGIQALEDSIVWVIPATLVVQLKKKYLQFETQYRTIIEKDWVAVAQAAHCSRVPNSNANYDILRRDSPELLGRVPVKYLANYTNMSETRFRRLHSAYGLKTVVKRR